jgi:ATPase subunit of ABC transporter with duplicated ATPase domains
MRGPTMKSKPRNKRLNSNLLRVKGLNLDTPTGRPLFRDLNLTLGHEQVALVGRNGVGKSTLVDQLSQREQPERGAIDCVADTLVVPQELNQSATSSLDLMTDIFADLLDDWRLKREFSAIGLRSYQQLVISENVSCGELRKLHLVAAKLKQPELLMLDEPTQDLDETGVCWLQQWIGQWTNGLIVISHERSILRLFSEFLIIAESGCRHFSGEFDELEKDLARVDCDYQEKYLNNVNALIKQEEHNQRVLQRRRQKKNQGRWREVARMTPKVLLNKKRSYAQESQAKVAKIRQDRAENVRGLVKEKRRTLSVLLPMKLHLPALPNDEGSDLISLTKVSVSNHARILFQDVNLTMQRDRLGVTGPNGAGKTTLLRTILGQHPVRSGEVIIQNKKIAAIAQGASDWMLEECLASLLVESSADASPETVERLLVSHKFPSALALRPLRSLSPGERVRAALISLFAKRPAIEFLILDEPTYALDFVGLSAIRAGLKAWGGGLIVVSHDKEFLMDIGIERSLQIDGKGGLVLGDL